jgi:tetratricopeptide (TPR) repeat protein
MTDPFKSGKVMTSEITEFEINPPIDTKVFEKKKPPVVDKPEMRSLTEARTIRIKEGWGGYGPGRSSEYELQRDANSFKGVAHFETEQRSGDQNVSIPLGIVTAFLKKLGESRLQDRQYVPYIDHTDDYPHVEIEVSTPAATVRFYSESQGEDHVPWAATIGNTTYVISSDVPARALESLSSYLERKVPLKVSPSVIAEQWLRSGMGKMNQRDLQGAIADFTKAIESKPDYYQAYEMRAQAKKMSNDYQGAIAEYTTLMRLAPGGTYLYERAQVKRELKDYQGAITDFTAFIESRPKYMLDVAYRARAAAKRELKDYGGEIADLTKLIELNSGRKDYGIYEERADAKYRSKDYRGVIEDLTKAVEIEPKLARGFYLRAKAKVELKDYRGAVADFTRAIDAVPDDPRDWYYTERGKAKQLLGDYQGAQADFEKAAELSRRKR